MKSDKKTLILLGTVVAFTLALFGAYAFLFFAIKNNTESTASISEKTDELSGRESRIASSVSILRREDANIEKLSAYYFKDNEIVAFTKRVEALGAQSKTTLTIETLDLGYTEKTVPFLNLRIRAVGKFADVERLLMLLESFPGKLEWKNVRLARDTQTTTQTDAGDKTPKPVSSAPVWRAEIFVAALNFVNQ